MKLKNIILKLAHKYVWVEILEELAEDCPNWDSCSESSMEAFKPEYNEGYD